MQNIMHNYANRLESGGAIDQLPTSEASPSATFRRAKRAQCFNATASVASMSLVVINSQSFKFTFSFTHDNNF